MQYNNPIIKGFYPDPSICKFKGRFYLVTSSFEYFPGIPIFESLDLVNWKQIGHCLSRKTQLELTNSLPSHGIFAPTIRTDGHYLYVIVTNRTIKKNFIVKTSDPSNQMWSDPLYIDGWDGIDPSLFFDDDGKVYIQGNAYKSNEQLGIYQAQINIDTGNLVTQRELICEGSGGKSPESPHIFKKDKFYYLTVAEGGTEYGHMVTIFRSNNISGPYESYINNPILTNRSTASKVQCVGHADIFEDYEHNWWTVCLGIRVSGHHAYYHHLGRETFLAPIEWNDDNWPCINKNGHIDLKMFGKLKNHQKNISNDLFMDFTKDKNISQRLVYLRNPNDDDYTLVKNKGLILNGSKKTLNDTGKVTFLGLRQSEFNVKYQAQFEFSKLNNRLIFGISTFMSKDYHFDLSVNLSLKMIYLKIKLGNIDTLLYKIPLIFNNHIMLEIDADRKYYYYYVYQNNIKTLIGKLECKQLSSEISATFTGTMLSVFCYSDNKESINLNYIKYEENN